MFAVKAKFDGKRIILPKGFHAKKSEDVIVWFESDDDWGPADVGYLKALETTLREVWDNPDDEVFNDL